MSKIKDALEKARRMRGVANSFVLVEDEFGVQDNAVPQTATTRKIINYSPDAILQHNIITLAAGHNGTKELFKLFKTQILTKTQMAGDRTILITSCIDGEGKTFTAINLAIMFAREVDQTVLLVDVNLKHPSITQVLGIEAHEGLTDYLLHNKPLTELLIRPGIDKLSLLPAGNAIEHSSEMLGSLKMQDLIAEMKGRYQDRYIFFDGPSILTSVDTLVLSKYVDKTLLVVESGKVSPEQLSEAINLIGEEKILGTVLNKRNPL
jgi:exopolysaccharide/PEP-CTERM locus tyrosine autokinase